MKFKKGDLVEVVTVDPEEDDPPEFDDDGNEVPWHAEKFIGRVGRIVEVKTGGRGSVGNGPLDPLFVVRVPVLGEDGFWAEELKKVP